MRLLKKLIPWLERRDFPFFAAGIALLITLPALWGGIATDDHYFRMIFQKLFVVYQEILKILAGFHVFPDKTVF